MSYRKVSGIIFAIVALLHAARAAVGIPVQIGSQSVPVAISWVAAVVSAALAFWALRGD